ncbi:ribonucleotide reductase inhibitor domain-containing protein [Trichoderma gracile]
MSTPRNKRQFAGAAADPAQRQITSFFTTQSPTSSCGTPEPALRPALPANVQANLLSVGMRVRKSVPEGYKTVTSSNSNNNILVWNDGKSGGGAKTSSAVAAVATRRPVAKELLPFCGINKVGGMDTQPELGYDEYDDDGDVPALDQVPELSMSQESTDSVAESGPSRKRFLDEQDEDVSFWDRDDGDVAGNSRTIAVPRSRMKKQQQQQQQPTALKAVDQENMVLDDDFEDANFLVYDSEKSMDMSV